MTKDVKENKKVARFMSQIFSIAEGESRSWLKNNDVEVIHETAGYEKGIYTIYIIYKQKAS